MLLTVYLSYAYSMDEKQLMRRFGKRVATVRKSQNITQEQLAADIEMSVVAIAYIETGKRWARLGTLNKIAKRLNVNINDLFKGL